MLAIKSVDDETELNNLRLTEELNVADYLYILKYKKELLYVSPDSEIILGETEQINDNDIQQAVTDILSDLNK